MSKGQPGVLIDLCRRHQDRQDDATFASINDVMGMIAQMKPAALETYRRGIRITSTVLLVSIRSGATSQLAEIALWQSMQEQ